MVDETVPTPLRATLQVAAVETHPCLIVLGGVDVGRVHRLTKPSILLGRDDAVDIRVPIDGVSRRHAEIRVDANGDILLVDLDSTNGVWVEGRRVSTHVLRDGERVQLGANAIMQFSLQYGEQEEIQQRLYDSATRDPLTGALNRRVFDDHLAREVSHARRHGHHVSLLLLDLDHFKAVNDSHGHQAGDHVLRGFGALVAESIRAEDLFCRVGGEEFAILTRDPGPEGALRFAERIRQLVSRHYFAFDGARLPVTVSIGVATYAPEYPTPEALFGAADEALYEAKHAGRNRVSSAE